MQLIDFVFYASILGAVLMAFAMGGNGAASSMASAFGARALSMRQAIFIAAIANFIGAILLGAAVTATVAHGIIDASAISDGNALALGMLSALLASGLFVLVATLMGFPVATSQAIVGGIAGFGVVIAGWGVVNWTTMTIIAIAWVVTPFGAGAISLLLSLIIRSSLYTSSNVARRIIQIVPAWMALVVVIVMLFVMREILPHVEVTLMELGLMLMVIASVVYILGYRMMRDRHLSKKIAPEESVQDSFRRLQIFTSGYISLAHGANDVANAIGPVLAIYLLAKEGVISENATVPPWILILGGAGIVAGIGAIGSRVIRTVGDEITKLDNVRGFSADFTTASTLMAASHFGLPVSAAQTAVGAVTGTGLAQGGRGIRMDMLARIFAFWFITVPVSALLSIGIYLLLALILLPGGSA